MKRLAISALFALCALCWAQAQEDITPLWKTPTNDFRMKTWWFFGYENTTEEGITADVDALKKAGFGGVVYYDQDHRGATLPEGTGIPDEGFSPEWWRHLKWAAGEARRAGLSFELNISNGYVAGGRWIDPRHAMQRVTSARSNVSGGKHIDMVLPAIDGVEGYVDDIALIAVPNRYAGEVQPLMRHFSARYKAEGKGRNGAMQRPGPQGRFDGYGWKDYPDVGTLQTSDDSTTWRDVVTIEPMYSSQGGYFYRTYAFPATDGKYWRVNYTGNARLREWSVGPEAMTDRWEERTGLHSDFFEDDRTPEYAEDEVIDPRKMIDLSGNVAFGRLSWDAPQGEWTIVRLAAVLTGAKSKHGRKNLLGYECDKLSEEAANLQWDSYVQVILDSLGADAGVRGITMDSHEGGAQNWTPRMLEEFRSRRGYDLKPYLPMLAGYVVESRAKTAQVLDDFRKTIAECIEDNYYGTFQRRAAENGLTFTAQAIGNALCIDGDAIAVKKAVEKPQGEFWTYQKDGAYDIKDCSSACHLYGKPVASAEALTDAEYKDDAMDLMRVCNIAVSFGAQEFVVCAMPHIPWVQVPDTLGRNGIWYKAGREYAINRSNPKWQSFIPVWQQNARTMVLMRQGKAASDVLVYLGDDVPMKIISSRLPGGLEHLDWDACTGDALSRFEARDGRCYNAELDDPIFYKAVLVADKARISALSQAKLDELRRAGVPVLSDGSSIVRPLDIVGGDAGNIVHTHRTINDGGKQTDLFYIANVSGNRAGARLHFNENPARKATVWYNLTGKKRSLKAAADGTFSLYLKPGESVCLTL